MEAAAAALDAQQQQLGHSASMMDMVARPGPIRSHALVLFFVWFSVSLSYYGISFSIPNLSGDRYTF